MNSPLHHSRRGACDRADSSGRNAYRAWRRSSGTRSAGSRAGCPSRRRLRGRGSKPSAAPPLLALTAQLARTPLEPLVVQAPLQMASRVGRVLDENRRQRGRVGDAAARADPSTGRNARSRCRSGRSASSASGDFRPRVATRAASTPRPCCAHPAQPLEPAPRYAAKLWAYPNTSSCVGRKSDRFAGSFTSRNRAGEPGIEPGLRRPKRRVRPLHHSPSARQERLGQVI